MGKKGGLGRKKKRHFTGNQHTKIKSEEISEKSASAKKLGIDGRPTSSSPVCLEENVISDSAGYRIIYLPALVKAITDYLCCKDCHNMVKLQETAVQGLNSVFNFKCSVCNAKKQFCNNPTSKNNVPEINRRMIYTMRCLGQGLASIKLFCGLMDLPPPVQQTTYEIVVNRIVSATKCVAAESMRRAVEEEVKLSPAPDKREITVSGDGSWKTRGHMSRYGIVSVIGAESGKVVDIKVKSSYCKLCSQWKGPKKGRIYDEWYENHKSTCTANHHGSAASMECVGLQEIFSRSERKHNVKYIEYIGDGDTKSFKMVHDSMPYGPDVDIKKLNV